MNDMPPSHDTSVRQLIARFRAIDTASSREIADDLQKIYTGEATSDSLFEAKERAKLERWEAYRTAERLEHKSSVICKKCGYEKWFHKEYGDPPYQCPSCRGEYAIVNDDSHYSPNSIKRSTQLSGLLFTLVVVVYVIYCLATGTVYIPAKHGPLEFHGWAMVPASLGLLLPGLHALTYILDHYDRRNNEYVYDQIRYSTVIGFFMSLLIAAGTQIYFMAAHT
jgi:predicted Zn-ribbon and HTH transcriptional regulator